MTAPRRQYSPEERAAMMTAVVEGKTTTEIAAEMGVPQSAAQHARIAALALLSTTDYREHVISKARAYADEAWPALSAELRVLSDEQWLREHPAEAFSLASAHRVLAETLGRILAAAG